MSSIKEIVKATAEKSGLSQAKVREVYDALVEVVHGMVKETEAGDQVTLLNLATFKVVDVPERVHRNPRTGEEVTKPAHKAVKAKLPAAVKNLV